MRFSIACTLICLAMRALAGDMDTASGIRTYVRMSDGVRLAVDVLPAKSQSRAPSLVQVTRYGRGGRDPAMTAHYRNAGFNQVFVDARGSGASFGTRPIEFSAAEVSDLGEIIDWIARQPWSDGDVAFTGNSYAGDVAELVTASGRRALKAAVIRHSEFDPYRHLTFPGGVRNEMILNLWGAAVGEEDRSESCLRSAAACRTLGHLEPVNGDDDYALVRQALAGHQLNFRSDRDLAAVAFIDDHTPAGPSLESIAAASRSTAIAAAAVPVQVWASWMDAGTAASALERYTTLPTIPVELFIAGWVHGGSRSADPFATVNQPAVMDRSLQLEQHTEFLHAVLAGKHPPRIIHYVPLGSTQWRETRQWPPAGVEPRRFYVSAGNALADTLPEGTGADAYAVDFSATTGTANRWRTQLGGDPVDYPARATQDAKLLVYTSRAFDSDAELAGRVRARLHLSVDRNDAAVFVYLEDVGPDGTITYLSEGQLRLLHRRPGPNLDREPSFRRSDAQPVLPDTLMEADVLLQPVAARIRAGHRLRIAIAGADADTFARYPADGALNLRVMRSATAPSSVDVPLRPWQSDETDAHSANTRSSRQHSRNSGS